MNILTTIAKLSAESIDYDGPKTADATFAGVLNLVYGVAAITAVIVIIIAGYFYVTSSGDTTKTKRAKDAILGAVIGLVVIVMAFAITEFVRGRF